MSEMKRSDRAAGSMTPKEWRQATEKLIRLTTRRAELTRDSDQRRGEEKPTTDKKVSQD